MYVPPIIACIHMLPAVATHLLLLLLVLINIEFSIAFLVVKGLFVIRKTRKYTSFKSNGDDTYFLVGLMSEKMEWVK